MVDVTFLKNDGVFVADDYQSLERASGRLRELADDGVQEIQRNRGNGIGSEPAVEAVLMSASVYDAALADIAANSYPSINASAVQEFLDDDLGRNITQYLDLIQGKSQVNSVISKTVAQGKSNEAFAVFKFINTKTTYVDNSAVIVEDGVNLGDVALGYLLHPSMASFLQNTDSLTATAYVGTGNGTISVSLKEGSIAEDITVTATSGGAPGADFAVVGSISGALGTVTADGGSVDLGVVVIEVTDGATAFEIGDEFTITSVAI